MQLGEELILNMPETILFEKRYQNNIQQKYNLSFISYGCETLYLTLRKEHELKGFENKVLERTFELKSDEVSAQPRILTLH
jgi:hypothetical protein